MNSKAATWRAVAILPFLFGGLIVWAVRFLAVYAFTAIACEQGWQDAVRIAIVGASVLAIGVDAAIIVAARRHDGSDAGRFIALLAAGIAALSIVAIALETIPAFMVGICAS